MQKTTVYTVLTLGLIFLTIPKPAYAYLDPGTGSYVFQLLIAGLLGSSFFMKSAIRKFIRKFRKGDDKKNPASDRNK